MVDERENMLLQILSNATTWTTGAISYLCNTLSRHGLVNDLRLPVSFGVIYRTLQQSRFRFLSNYAHEHLVSIEDYG